MYRLKVNKIVLPKIGAVTPETFIQDHADILKAMDKEFKTNNVGKFLEEVTQDKIDSEDAAALEEAQIKYEEITGKKAGKKGIKTLLKEIEAAEASQI